METRNPSCGCPSPINTLLGNRVLFTSLWLSSPALRTNRINTSLKNKYWYQFTQLNISRWSSCIATVRWLKQVKDNGYIHKQSDDQMKEKILNTSRINSFEADHLLFHQYSVYLHETLSCVEQISSFEQELSIMSLCSSLKIQTIT